MMQRPADARATSRPASGSGAMPSPPHGRHVGIPIGILLRMATTTIKVPVELRDRINRDARERGVSAARLIEGLLDAYERRQRMEAFGRAFRQADQGYWDDFRSWDVSLDDGRADA